MNETLNVNLNNLTEEERNTLLALVEKSVKEPESKVWKPKENETYYYVRTNGTVTTADWTNDRFDNVTYVLGNCYRTEKEAKFALEKQKVYAELKRFAQEHNETEIDWNNDTQRKYYLYYNFDHDCLIMDFNYKVKYPNAIYFTSKEIAEQAIKAIGEERIKRYYLEVE